MRAQAYGVSIAASSERRGDKTKLLTIDRKTGGISHGAVRDLPERLHPGDVLVVNDASTLPASLRGLHLATRTQVELRMAMPASLGTFESNAPVWLCVLFGTGDWRVPTENRAPPPIVEEGDFLDFGVGLRGEVQKVCSEVSSRLLEVRFESGTGSVWAGIFLAGRPIQYSYLRHELKPWDQQTIFSSHPVAVEPPSASFPFSWDLVFRLKERGIEVVSLTHATGLSSTGDRKIDSRLPFPEFSRVPESTVRAILRARNSERGVVALGTGVTRALESGARLGFPDQSFMSYLRIRPETDLQIVTGVLTGMHEDGASHLDLLGAFVDEGSIKRGYGEAKERGYLWHEYGDVCLIS